MLRFKYCVLALALLLCTPIFTPADTITQTNAEGQRMVVQTNAIVIENDSYAVVYKHFDLQQRRVVKAKLNQGSLPYNVVESNASERQQIVRLWEKFGYTATVTTRAGKKTQVYDCYFDFFPGPGGIGAFLESVPPRANLPIQFDSGGVDQIEFDQITSIANQNGHLTVTLTNGKVETGKFLMPTQQPAVVHFMGITGQYQPASSQVYDFSMPLPDISEIRFDSDP
ncbi:MAG TPA: hypothetical protein VGX94_17780 [Terriglobia bacterium]|nr:hypothetical protein [Terriglobia bacterium]